MTEMPTISRQHQIDALCQTAHGAFAVAVSDITPDGCIAEALETWADDFDFLRLTLAGRAEVAGRIVHHDGRVAEIRFFGQISPLAIESWQRRAA